MLLILFGRLGQFLLAFAGIRLATTLLTPSEMGRMALVIAVTSAFALVLVNPVGMFINRRLHAWEALGRATGYLMLYWGYLGLVAVLSAVVLYIGVVLGLIDINVSYGWLAVLVCGSLFFNTINQTYIPSLNLLGFRGWFVSLTLATQVIGLAGATFLVTNNVARAEYWLLGLLIGQMLIGLVSKAVFDRKVGQGSASQIPPDALSRKYQSALLKFAWPVSIAVGLGWLQSQSYRFFLEDAAGLAQLGLFVAGYLISAGIIAAFESVLTTYFQPEFYKGINTRNSAERAAAWNSYAEAIFPALIVTVFLISGLSRELSQVLLGPNFQDSAQFVLWGALAEATRVIVGTYTLSVHAQMQTRSLLLPHVVGAMVSLFLAWLLIPSLGGIGAGVALLSSGSILAVILAWQAHRNMGITLPVHQCAYGVLAGIIIFLFAEIVERATSPLAGAGAAIASLGIVGLAYAAAQYFLIYPMLQRVQKRL